MSYFEVIVENIRSGNIKYATTLYRQCKEENLLSKSEIDELEKIFPDEIDEFGYQVDNPDSEFILRLFNHVKKGRSWDDDMISRNLKIKKEDIMRIKERRSKSKIISYKLYRELFKEILRGEKGT
jgi:hypothetical protein